MKKCLLLCTLVWSMGTARAELRLESVFSLGNVVAITHAGDSRLFITVKSGVIRIWDGTQLIGTPFLDIDSLVLSGGERGLLSVAFHPDYNTNGFFYVYYTNNSGNTVVARYERSVGDPNVADPSSAAILLTINQPLSNHNGGQMQFGPDGFLYIGTGDGGGSGDPDCAAQQPDGLLGKMIRLDVDQNVNTAPFHGIPNSNPFVSDPNTRDEIWSLGLRNPWRFSFDRDTGDLFIADVGQNAWEEINYVAAGTGGGENYGWDVMEGLVCFQDDPDCPGNTPSCNSNDLVDPVHVYNHAGNCSVTGGYLYRGCDAPEIYGKYIYADFCSNRVWALEQTAPGVWSNELLNVSAGPTTFGEGLDGTLYVEDGGTIYRFVGGSYEEFLPQWNVENSNCPIITIVQLIQNLP